MQEGSHLQGHSATAINASDVPSQCASPTSNSRRGSSSEDPADAPVPPLSGAEPAGVSPPFAPLSPPKVGQGSAPGEVRSPSSADEMSVNFGVDGDPFVAGGDGGAFGDGEDHIAFDFGENDEDYSPFTTFQLRDKINFALEGIPESFSGIEELFVWMKISAVVTNFSLFVVFLSCVNIAVDTLPQLWNKRHPVTFGIETACIIWFTIELVVRFVTSREKLLFFTKWLNIIDLISIIPYYVDSIARLTGDEDAVASARAIVLLMVLRFTRLTRVLKLSKHSDGMQSIFETLSRSQAALSLMFFLLTICIIVGSTAVYFSEQTVQTFDYSKRRWVRKYDGTDSPFQSIFHTFWFSLVTITTVGYGDDTVVSLLGKLSTVALMLIGVFVIAFPTVILSSNFHDIHNSRLARREVVEDKLRRMAAHAEDDRRGSVAARDDDDAMDEEEEARMMFMRRRKLTARRMSYSYVEKELAQAVLEYKVASEPSLTRGIFLNGYHAEYAPLLALEREEPLEVDVGGAREEERPIIMSVQGNFPVGVIVSFGLILHTRAVHDAASRSVDHYLGPAALLLTVVPRPIKKLEVTWASPHPLLQSAKVVTKTFRNPVGKVTVQLHLPYFDALPALLRYNAGAFFHFDVDYEVPEWDTVAGTHMDVAAKYTRRSTSPADQRRESRFDVGRATSPPAACNLPPSLLAVPVS